MSDIPDKIMKAAMEAYESLSVACISSRPIDFRAEDIVIVARALMAADEAATKRERERCISVVQGIADRHTLAASSCHLDGEKDAAALASYCARSIDDIAAILKGEA